MSLVITSINVYPHSTRSTQGSSVLALISFTLNNMVKICGAKVIQTETGRMFIQFPDRPQMAPCDSCGRTVMIVHDYCGRCGARQSESRNDRLEQLGTKRAYQDVFHPLTQTVRMAMEAILLQAYEGKQAIPVAIEAA